MRPRLWRPGLLDAAAFATLGLVIVLLWAPVVVHYHVPRPAIADEVIEAARSSPADEVLRELGGFRFFGGALPRDAQVAVAEKLLQGVVEPPGRAPVRLAPAFDPDDLERGGLQLFLASFGVPRQLLDAYGMTGREEFLDAARAYVLAWARYEERAWLPRGLLWNDHAVSERVLVLSEFWRFYRRHPGFDAGVARRVLQLVARYGALLSAPPHFAFNTNHGVMQNLALLHLSVAFPRLPDVDSYKGLAFERLGHQLAFYVSDEGVVLEHSPGYHRAGLEFLGKAMRYSTLLGMEPPRAWQEKYRLAKRFYAQVRLPDGSLPLFGDTAWKPDPQGPLLANLEPDGRVSRLDYEPGWAPPDTTAVYPVSGYAVWWNGLRRWPDEKGLGQTVIGWSHFPGHGHPRAYEMSLWVWAGGQTWWSNIGLWPYDHRDRSEAVSWSASNAPHLSDEHAESARRTTLRTFASADDVSFIDLERSGPDGYVARRQIVWSKPETWLVLDTSSARRGTGRIVWTTAPDVTLEERRTPGSFTLHGKDAALVLDASFLGSAGTSVRQIKGSLSPFAGWGMVGTRIRPASAIVIEQPAHSAWAVATWSLHREDETTGGLADTAPAVVIENDQSWKISLRTRSGDIALERRGEELTVVRDRGGTNVGRNNVALQSGPDSAGAYEAIRGGYFAAQKRYARFFDLHEYRLKATWLLIGAFLLQEIAVAYVKTTSVRGYRVARWLTLWCWAAGGFLATRHFSFLVETYTRLAP